MRGCGIRRGRFVENEAEKLRERQIDQELKKLKRTFTKLDSRVKKAVENLMHNAAFMSVTLQELQKQINKNGVISEYKNGENQFGTKKSPEVETYNTMIKNYSAIIKQLTDLLPKKQGDDPPKVDQFADFVNARK